MCTKLKGNLDIWYEKIESHNQFCYCQVCTAQADMMPYMRTLQGVSKEKVEEDRRTVPLFTYVMSQTELLIVSCVPILSFKERVIFESCSRQFTNFTSASMASEPKECLGTLIEVSGGAVISHEGRSLKPITEISSGIRIPFS